MKWVVVAYIAISGMWAGQALAQCSAGAGTTQVVLLSRLQGTTVCGRPGANYPGPGGVGSPDRWQEQHLAGGQLWDYKKGPGDAVDPSKQMGTWSVANDTSASATITHSYTGGPSFTYTVFNTGGVLSFCVGPSEYVRARVKSGATSCADTDFP